MKRRVSWTVRLQQRLRARRQVPACAAAYQAGAQLMQPRVVLRFRDGSSVVLNPACGAAVEMHALADRWLTGR